MYTVYIYRRPKSFVAVVKAPDGARAGSAEAASASSAWAAAAVAAFETIAREAG